MVGNQQSHPDSFATPDQPYRLTKRLRACTIFPEQANGERGAAHGTEEACAKASGEQFISL
jgi:hypothetical protein